MANLQGFIRLASRAAGSDLQGVAQTSQREKSPHEDLLLSALESLSRKDRLAVSLRYFSEMPVADIAKLLSVPQGTVKSRLYHARKIMRKEIEKMAKQIERAAFVPGDFREIIADQEGEKPWRSLLTGDLDGWSITGDENERQLVQANAPPSNWRVLRDGLIGEPQTGANGSCLTIGDSTWRDYEISMMITPLWGGNAQVFFRMGESLPEMYILDMLMGWQAIGVHKVEAGSDGKPKMTRLSVVNYPLVHEQEYALSIAARGQSLTTYVDGALVNQVTDDFLPTGGLGLNVWQSKTLYRDVRVRHLAVPMLKDG